jgi:SAM-dependent methyltransferase
MIRFGRLIESLAVMVMRPDDLIEFGRRNYARTHTIADWSRAELVDAGLNDQERPLLEHLPPRKGRLLLLGVGGGREAIPLAQMGFEVIGVDFIPGMVEKAKENAARHGVTITGLVQEISRLEVAASSFDVAWLSAAMYSCVPTRRRRIEMLQRVGRAIRPGGYFVCQFHWSVFGRDSRRMNLVRRAVAFLTLGNLSYEPGDILWAGHEFIHGFLSVDEIRSEILEGGFNVAYMSLPRSERNLRGGMVLRKPPA